MNESPLTYAENFGLTEHPMALRFLQWFTTRSATNQGQEWQALGEEAARALRERRFEVAVQLYDKVIELRANDAEAFYKRANAHNGLGRWQEALADYDQAVALESTHARAYCNRGVVLERMARWDAALESYDRAIELNPEDFLSHYNRGATLKELERFEDALASYQRAIELNNNYAAAFVNRGNVLQKLRRFEAAIASYDQAIGLDASVAEAHQGRGISLVSIRRFREALASYDQAIQLNDRYVEAFSNRGSLLQEIGRHDAALASFAKAIELRPAFPAALQGSGFSLLRLHRFESAIKRFDEALASEAERRYLLGMRIYAQMQICDWTDLTLNKQKLSDGLRANKPLSVPLPVLALADAPALHRSVAASWVENECPLDSTLGVILMRPRHGKIRVGYFSSDFCEHAVSFATAELFELHDRSRVEITAFAFGPRPNDRMRNRLQKAFDRFLDVRDKSDVEVARMARAIEIDIAVDLNGYTEFSRTNIFALRAAPIQINYLGYPGTMGAEYIDYMIADPVVVPESDQCYYAEKIIYLPNCYLPHDSTRTFVSTEFTRKELGLPMSEFVFCCFNNNYKIVPEVFDIWMRILNRMEHSVLWLAQNDSITARNLRREAERRGVNGERLIFASRTDSIADHLSRLRSADLILDTLPYNAHVTATDALWAGVPLITRCGAAFAGRVAASALKAIGLPQLISSTDEQYENLAVHLATNPQVLAEIRTRLRQCRIDAPLFNTRLFANHLEIAYEEIFDRYHAGRPPDHVYVSS